MDVSDAYRLTILQDRNAELKELLVKAMPGVTMLKDLGVEKFYAHYDVWGPCSSRDNLWS